MTELKIYGFIAIILVTLLSCGIATSVDMSNFGLGAFENMLLPPLIGIISAGIFLFISWVNNSKKVIIVTLVILCLYNIYAGIAIRNTYSPFPF